jgi:hypothetical protein
MSHRIHPSEAEGIAVPSFWEKAAEALRELDERPDDPEPREIRLAASDLQAA